MRVRGVLAVLVLAGCGGDTTITKRNDAPTAAIGDPTDGTSAREGDTLTLRGTVTDADDGAGDLLATWFSGADVLCEAAPIAEDGATDCEVVVGLDDAVILLEGRDPDNATGIASIELEILPTGVPSVDIYTPDGTGRLYADHAVTFSAAVADTEDDPTALAVAWTDETDAAVDIDAAADADGSLAGSWAFAEGPHAVTLSVTDTSGKTASTTVAFAVGAPNVPPTCSITAPADGYATVQGVDVAFTGTVDDPDVAEDSLVATWESDLDGTLSTGNADVDGNVALTTAALGVGTHTITLTGVDEVGGTCVDSIVVHVGAPPSIDIDLPVDGDVYNEGVAAAFSATVSDDVTAPDALSLTWESDVDGVLDTTPADTSGVAQFEAGWLSVGAHTVTLTAIDEVGLSASASVSFVVNGLPTAPGVEIDPSSPDGDDDLVATVTVASTDPEADPVTYSYAWYVDGAATAYTSATLPAAATTRGELWEVYVTPDDGYGDGASGTASVTIANTAPTLADVSLTPDPAYEGDTLACTPGSASDADGDAITYTYAWTVDGVALADTTASIDASNWARGDVVVCTVTPTDGTLAGTPVASNALTISNSTPSLASVEITPADPAATDTLTCAATGFDDADGDADESVYEWTVNGVYAGTGTTLAGGFLGGDEVICAVTPYDGTDYGPVLSEAVTIENTPPELSVVTLTPLSPTEADVLVCSPGATTDADGTTSFSYTYAWTVDGAALAASGSTLDGSYFAKGEEIACFVTPNDGTDDGATVASDTVTAVNSAPEVTAVTLAPTSPATGDTITATVSTDDIDGDAVSVSYAWYVDGAAVAGTSASLTGGSFDAGDTVYVVVTPNDGTEDGAPVASASVTVANTLPVLTSVTLTPTTAYEASTLTCTAIATDDDGDAVSFTYTWTVNGAGIAATGATLTGADFDRDDAVACTATPDDGTGAGTAGTSNTVTISNTAPVASTLSLTPTSATESSTLTCTPSATDADGDAISWTYAWYVDGAAIGATTSTLTGTSFGSGDAVYCRATPTDGTTAGTAMSSNTVTISNTAPVLSAVTLTPTSATEASTLTCTPTSSDADGDTVSYTYTWYVGGSAVAATGATLTGTYFEAGDAVYCSVTPDDGTTSGTAMSSNTVTVSNTAPVVSSVSLTPTTAYEASTLTCTPTATDADGDAISYTYAWYVNSAAAAATSSTLTGTYFDRGDMVSCAATPNDGTTSGSAVSSNTVTISNTAPVASTVSLTPTSATESSTLTCTPSATDADGDAISWTYAWYVDGAAIGATTSTLTGTSFGSGDAVYCRATPTDGTTAGTAMSSNTVTISNTAPVLSAVTLTPTSATEASTLTCTPTSSDADGDTVSYTYTWYVGGSAVAATGATLTGTYFEAGDAVYCRVTPNDGTTSGSAMSSNTVTISNTAPVVSSVSLTPTTAYEASTLTCTPTATDADGDAITYTYAWYVNSAAIAATSSTLTGTYFDRSDTVYCRATPNDGTTSGTAVNSNTVAISNTAPVASTVSLTPTSATESSTLTCSPSATDADGDAISWTYTWYVDGAAIAATTSTLTGTSFGSGDAVYCRATPTDGTTAGTAMSSNTVTISNTAPVLSAVTLTPTSATEASTLTCTPTSSDADGDTVSYTYTWYVGGSAVAATGATLTGTYFEAGDAVYCRVTPNDGTTSGSAMSSNTVTISNTAPVVSSVSLTPTTAYEASTLTCTPTATDADGDAITYTYAWYVNSAAIAATSSTLTGTYFDRSDTVYCRATPNDGTTSGTAVNSNTVAISNTAPVASTVSLTPTSATESSTLTCSPSATDADGDAISWTYTWYVDGAAIAATTSTLTGTSFGSGDAVYCRATPTDGTTAGTAMSSNTVTISNTAPVLSAVTLTPTSATEASTLTCTPTSSDADGDTVSYTYTWYVGGSAVAATGATLTGTYFEAGDAVYCRVTPNDGTTSGSAMSSNTVTISNTAPVVSSVSLTPTTAYEASTLTCTPTATDADGDAITYTYAWYVGGAAIAATSSTLTGTYFERGDSVYCRATPSDGTTSGSTGTSNTANISNTAPVASSVALTPTTAYESSTLTCTPTSTDADGDAISHTYAWYVNGSSIGRTTSTLTGTYFARGDTVYCRATPTDGATAGTAVSSNTVTISNTAPVLASVSLTPTTAYEASTLTCTPGSVTDADGTTSFTYTYAWYVNGASIGRTTSTLTGTYFDEDDAVYCRVTPNDGTGSGSAVSSNTVTISNTAPGAPVLAISPTEPIAGVDDLLCEITTASTDADGDTVDYDITWTVDGAAYPGSFSGTTGPTTTTWTDDTIPAADTDLGTTWACTAVPFDDDEDGTSASASVDVLGDCGGVPVASACSGETVQVAYLPGWSSSHTGSASLVYSNLETNSLTYGDCTIDITSVGSGFTLGTLSAYQAIIISDPSGGSRLYTSAEMTAIRDYLEGGYGGAVGSFLVDYLAYDNTPLMDLFGIDATGITGGASAVTTGGTVVDATHPVADNLPASFTLLGYGYEQSNSGGWDSTDLLECASFVVDAAGESSIIANDDYAWRTVFFTGMPEYNNPGANSKQALYNSILWAAGYQ